LVRELGIRFLRYGVPVHRTYLAPDRFDWIFADQTFSALRERRLGPLTVIGGRTPSTAARRKEVDAGVIQRLRRSLDGLARAW
jgi:hypothetical protein